jgi:hypothetical protein
MPEVVAALEALNLALTTAQALMLAAQQIGAMIGTAEAEGRDLTDAEVGQVIAARKQAEAALQAHLAA